MKITSIVGYVINKNFFINNLQSTYKKISIQLCSEVIMSQQHLVYHINENHSLPDGVLCVFDNSCPTFDDLIQVQEHIFRDHINLIP